MTERPCIAYLDGANVYKGVASAAWKIDYRRFRSWLRQKYGVSTAHLFIGLIPKHAQMYTSLQSAGYAMVFKEVVYDGMGKAKGNCDADLVLQAVRDVYERTPSSVVLVSSDGDYAPLVRFWQEKGIPCTVISPAPMAKCSILLKRTEVRIVCLEDVKNKVSYRR